MNNIEKTIDILEQEISINDEDKKILRDKEEDISQNILPITEILSSIGVRLIPNTSDKECQLYYINNNLLEMTSDKSIGNKIIKVKENKKSKLSARIDFKWFLTQFYKGDILLIFLGGAISNILLLFVPLFKMNVFDKVLPNGFIGNLIWLIIIVFAILIIWFLNKSMTTFLLGKNISEVEGEAKEIFINQLLYIKYRYMPEKNSSLTQIINASSSANNSIGNLHAIALIDLPFSLVFILMTYILGGSLVYITLISILIIVIVNILLQPKVKDFVSSNMSNSLNTKKVESEILHLLKPIKLLNMQDYYFRLHKSFKPKKPIEFYRLLSFMSNFNTFITMSSLVLVISFGALKVIDNEISIGALVACVIFTSKSLSLTKISGTLFNFYKLRKTFENINAFISKPKEGLESKLNLSSISKIALKNISFCHGKDKPLNNVSLEISKDIPCVIYGVSGAGKSTLFNIMSLLEQPDNGGILMDGISVNSFSSIDVRNKILFISSDLYLFSGTILDNIILNETNISHKDISYALDSVMITEKINNLDSGLSYEVVDQNHLPFSSGEIKKILLAKIFLGKADYIILDEPFDYLDEDSAKIILLNILEYVKNNNIGLLILTNKMSKVKYFNKRYMLANGYLKKIN